MPYWLWRFCSWWSNVIENLLAPLFGLAVLTFVVTSPIWILVLIGVLIWAERGL